MGDNMYAEGAPNEQTHTKTERKLDGLSGATKMADLLHRGVFKGWYRLKLSRIDIKRYF